MEAAGPFVVKVVQVLDNVRAASRQFEQAGFVRPRRVRAVLLPVRLADAHGAGGTVHHVTNDGGGSGGQQGVGRVIVGSDWVARAHVFVLRHYQRFHDDVRRCINVMCTRTFTGQCHSVRAPFFSPRARGRKKTRQKGCYADM
eukprot:scaffold181603_cov47-Prasinocladus_malaysianus.AAC.1